MDSLVRKTPRLERLMNRLTDREAQLCFTVLIHDKIESFPDAFYFFDKMTGCLP